MRTPLEQFGLLAWLEGTRIALPLKGVECRFEVTGELVGVELDQIYYQSAGHALDCTYTFPLPAGAAVYRCELHVNGRVIRAKVEARDAARRIFAEQKAAGHRAALVEQERENVFTLSLGNVQPEDVVVVRLAWFQLLDRTGEQLRMLVPTCPGVRYIPGKPLLRELSGRGIADDTDQVPDASRISPPRIDALHPDAAYFAMEGRLFPSDVESGSVSSPSHAIYVREQTDIVRVDFSREGQIPDRDLVLVWKEPKALELASRAWHWTEGTDTYAFVQFRAPAEVQVAEELDQDFFFLIDRSGSMEGAKWHRTCQAMHAFVKLLGAADRVWLTFFESDFQDFAEAPLPAAKVLTDRRFLKMETLGVGGGTELLPAANHVLGKIAKHSADRRTNVVIITDGQVGNEDAILEAFRKAEGVIVHTFGIDTAVNDAFLKSLAKQQRGGCWLQTPNDDIAGTIAALADRLRRPVLTKVSVNDAWELPASTCPDIHAREVVSLVVRGAAGNSLEIEGRRANGEGHRFTVSIGPVGHPAIALLWVRERISALLANGNAAEAIALAKKHNLICKGAAFIAWDEAEKVQVAETEVVQPAFAPAAVLTYRAVCPAPPTVGEQFKDYRAIGAAPSAAAGRPSPGSRNIVDRFRKAVKKLTSGASGSGADHLVEARESLTQAGVPENLVRALMSSVKGSAVERQTRAGELSAVGRAIRETRERFQLPRLREAFEREFAKASKGSGEDFEQWARQIEAVRQAMATVMICLNTLKIPEPVLDYLLVRVFNDGSLDQQRLDELTDFVASHRKIPRQDRPRHLQVALSALLSDADQSLREVVATTP